MYDRGYRAYDELPRYYDRETQYGGQRSYNEARLSEGRYRDDEPGIADRARQSAGNVAGSVRETASDVAGNVRETASDVADRARETAGPATWPVGRSMGRNGSRIASAT